MFKDLKEYQEITQLYHDSVNISEEQRAINKAIADANFTDEEIIYLDENFDEIWESEFQTLTEEAVLEFLSNEELNEEQLQEVRKKIVKKMAPKAVETAKSIGGMLKKGFSAVKKKIPQGVKDKLKSGFKNVKDVAKSALTKAKPLLKSVPKLGLAAGAVGGGIAAVNALRNRGKKKKEAEQKKKDAELDKKIKQGIKDSGMGDKGTAITQKGKEQAAYNKGERAARKKLGDPTLNLTKSEIEAKKKTDPPKETKVTEKPKKMSAIEKKNRARFGDAHVDKLKAKQKDFKLMRSKKMSKDDFIKKYPKSITAQKAAGLRDHTEWDAYDMVLEYLFSTEQVTSLEEANYVMMEMEQQTIGEIVKEVTVALSE